MATQPAAPRVQHADVPLGAMDASGTQRIWALSMAAGLVAAFAITAPSATVPLLPVPTFVPAYNVAVAILDLLTAVLLHAQYRDLREPGYLWLACGYLLSCILAVAHGLSFPDAFVPGSLFGDAQTTAWLWMAWHGIPPVYVSIYALTFRARTQVAATAALHRAAYAITLAISVVLIVVAAHAASLLPSLMSGNRYESLRTNLILTLGWSMHFIAFGLLWWRTRLRRMIDLWIAITVLAQLIDLALSGLLVTGRYQLGFYVGRLYGLVAAICVLGFLLRSALQLHNRLLRTTATLRESELRYRDLFDSIGEAFYVVELIRDADGRAVDGTYLQENPTAREYTGMSVVGKRLSEVDPDVDEEWLSVLEAVANSREDIAFDRPSRTSPRHFHYRVFPIAARHLELGVLFSDITSYRDVLAALRKSEERLNTAIEVGRLAMWDLNLLSDEVEWSDEHYRIEGYERGEVTPSYEAWADRLHPDDREAVEAAVRTAMETGEDYARDVRFVLPDGSIRWASARGRFFYDETGRAVRMVGAMLDTTQNHQWEAAQRTLVSELQHRTRNLIGVVQSIMTRTLRESTALDDFAVLFRERMASLARVQGLLSRLKDGQRVAFDELLRMELAAHVDVGDPQRVRLHGPDNIWLRSTSVQLLALALHELATNAIKYGALAAAEGRLDVSWRVDREDDRQWLHMEWRESGVRLEVDPARVRGGGAGRELIERALPYQFGARASYAFTEDGIRCCVSLPISRLNA